MADLAIVRFCAEECERQESGELSVYNMVNAYYYMMDIAGTRRILRIDIRELGVLVEPEKNRNGFRQTPVLIRDSVRQPVPAESIGHCLNSLLDAMTRLTAEEFYLEFEQIHPFIDGNGRVGAILYNWLKGKLTNPIAPPDFAESMERHT